MVFKKSVRVNVCEEFTEIVMIRIVVLSYIGERNRTFDLVFMTESVSTPY